MENSVENLELAIDVAPIIPDKEKNSFIIPWENREDLYISSDYFLKLYKGEIPLEDFHLYSYSVRIIKVNKFKWPLSLRRDGNYKNKYLKIDLEIKEIGLKVKCDCKKRHDSLCDYVIIGLYRKFLLSNKFLHDLYAKDIAILPESQHKYFQLGISRLYYRNDKVCIENHNQFGQVYNYFDHQELESELLDVASENRWLGQPEAPFPDFMYVIPKERQVDGLPFLIPFEIDSKINYLGEFGNELVNFTDSDVLKMDLCRKILAFSKSPQRQIRDREKDDVRNDFDRVEKDFIISAWRKLLEGKSDQRLRVAFVDRNNFKTTIENFKYPSKYRTTYRNVILAGDDLSLKFHLKEDSGHLLLSLILVYKGEELKDYTSECRSNFFFINLNEDECLFVDNLQKEFLLRFFHSISTKITVLKRDYEDFFTRMLIPLSTSFHIDLEPLNKDTVFISNTAHHVFQFKVVVEKDEDDHLNFELKAMLSEKEEYVIPYGGNLILKPENGTCLYTERDLVGENEFNTFIEAQFPNLKSCSNRMVKRLERQAYSNRNRLYEFIKKCKSKGYKTMLNNISKGAYLLPHQLKWEVLDIRQDNNVFSIYMIFKFGTTTYLPGEFEEKIVNDYSSIQLVDKSFGYIKASDKALFDVLFNYAVVETDCLKLTSAQLLSFQTRLDRIDPRIIQNSLAERREKLLNTDEIALLDVPKEIQAELRPYQQTGFSWMVFLNEFQWGGILADDMGLGKTLQAITLLEYFYQNNPKAAPSIIIVPNSLLFNWQSEFKKFAPNRGTLIYHGQKRKEIRELANETILITTYGTVMMELDFLKSQSFSYMILDESQAVKNRHSKRFKSLIELQSCYRIAMTGTPIENGVEDIYAQMSMVNPGFFGSYSSFNKTYPGIKGEDIAQETVINLQKMIQPFILRRTKKQVALDLPEKTETILYMDMLPGQRKIYDKVRKIFKGEIESNLNSADATKSKFLAIEALQKLRQLCNSPVLMKDGGFGQDSIKLDFIDEIMDEVAPNHKILLFSAYTSMLKLVGQRIENKGIAYTYLDGKMNQDQRQNAVERFQSEDECRVFLISLKAGGTGLNLTAADYVYILDPWWNPAAEAQAIDRCYRIGQDKHVMAYKIVCRDSVEEYILALQESKKRISEGLILDETNLMKSISKEELLKLFE